MFWIDPGTEVVVLNSQVVPICQVVVKTGFTGFAWYTHVAKLIFQYSKHSSLLVVGEEFCGFKQKQINKYQYINK